MTNYIVIPGNKIREVNPIEKPKENDFGRFPSMMYNRDAVIERSIGEWEEAESNLKEYDIHPESLEIKVLDWVYNSKFVPHFSEFPDRCKLDGCYKFPLGSIISGDRVTIEEGKAKIK